MKKVSIFEFLESVDSSFKIKNKIEQLQNKKIKTKGTRQEINRNVEKNSLCYERIPNFLSQFL